MFFLPRKDWALIPAEPVNRRKIRLINPNSKLSTITMPELIQHMTFSRKALFMPTGLAVCAAAVPEDWHVELIDECTLDKGHVPKADVDIVGISAMTVAYLAQAVGQAVGANVLLLQIGAYYHDIGKVMNPNFFTENQFSGKNTHDDLVAEESSEIIINHVREGRMMARGTGLPDMVIDLINQHHGTQLVEYFFHEATKKESESGRSVSETEFRYPGPKPASKEAAILMLTDAVEGATRAMQEPTPNRIEDVVHKMAMKRLLDRQFDECDLTMRELHLLEESLVKSLCGMYHSRIAYPKANGSVRGKVGVGQA